MRRILVAAVKGGTGRTTTSVTLAHGLSLAGRRVVLVDCDPRRQAALHFGLPPDAGLAAWLAGGAPPLALEVRTGLRVVDSGGPALVDVERDLASAAEGAARLRACMAGLADADFVLFDGPGWPGFVHASLVAAVDDVLLPVSADFLSLACAQAAFPSLRAQAGPRILGLLPTFCPPGGALRREVEAVLHAEHPGRVLESRVHLSAALRRAPARRGTVFDFEPLSAGARDYALLTEEILAS